MTDPNIANHTLELLRRVDAKLDRVDERLGRIEVRLTGIEQTTGALLSMYGAQNERIDRLEADMQRVKRRLELVD